MFGWHAIHQGLPLLSLKIPEMPKMPSEDSMDQMCVVHAFTLKHQEAEGGRDPGMAVAVVEEWVVVVVGGVAQGDHSTQMTAVTSVERGVIMHTTAPEEAVVDEDDAAGAGLAPRLVHGHDPGHMRGNAVTVVAGVGAAANRSEWGAWHSRTRNAALCMFSYSPRLPRVVQHLLCDNTWFMSLAYMVAVLGV